MLLSAYASQEVDEAGGDWIWCLLLVLLYLLPGIHVVGFLIIITETLNLTGADQVMSQLNCKAWDWMDQIMPKAM